MAGIGVDRRYATEFDLVFDRLSKLTGIKTLKGFGELLGLHGGTVSYAKQQGKLNDGWLERLKENCGLNPKWVMTGEGRPYLTPEELAPKPKETVPTDRPDAHPAIADSHVAGRAVPYTVMAGTGDTWEAEPIGTVSIPETLCEDTPIAVRADNDSMAPSILRGAYVGLDKKGTLEEGAICAIQVPHYGLIIRRVYITSEGYKLIADNKNFEAMVLSAEDAQKYFVGRVIWTMQKV